MLKEAFEYCLDVWQLDMGQLSWINFTIPSNSDGIWYRLPWSTVHNQFPSYCAQPTDYSRYIYKNMAQRSVFLYYCCPQSIADKFILNKIYISLLLQFTVYSQYFIYCLLLIHHLKIFNFILFFNGPVLKNCKNWHKQANTRVNLCALRITKVLFIAYQRWSILNNISDSDVW